MSDEGSAADDAASDGGGTQDDSRASGGRTALVTKPAARPQRPTGKRSRQKAVDTDADIDVEASTTEDEVSEEDSATKKAKKGRKPDTAAKAQKAKKAKKAGSAKGRAANPIAFIYNYLKQVVAEMRKVIWPSRKQMITYTSVVLAFLAFMVTLVGLADYGLTKLAMWVFGHGW